MDSCMLIVILGKGQAKTAMKAAREAGASGGTVFSARGTASSTILAALGLGDSSKEVLFSVIKDADAIDILNAVKGSRTKGVAMVIDDEEDAMDSGWRLIEIVCERGYSDDIMAVARKAGAGGGTVVNAHGTSTEDDVRFFGSPLVPEKELLMIVIEKGKADAVMEAVSSMEILRKKGMGIVFSLPVTNFQMLG